MASSSLPICTAIFIHPIFRMGQYWLLWRRYWFTTMYIILWTVYPKPRLMAEIIEKAVCSTFLSSELELGHSLKPRCLVENAL